ncbi:NAD-dependent epimerase/dehydratase family protein [Psychromarinibacter halotolerans]|uniref:NAD-dependent epimerase/dehydratase family protein n=1 Tax=Psychromarinibacter halotolerans TaxID=1775175 RepID=A0ABV7GYW4_9RHOB|nr:NAD(P)-dependent oxidoreductase [Psychromarinibacter halotolerans]MDF0598503.1 NAD(P)-dependent oxidoreductase [Psychromarinibacter halotolerans]
MKVLVTGSSGFLGSSIIGALARRGDDPVGLDIVPPSGDALIIAPDLAARTRIGHVGDLARLFDVCRTEKIEAIIHTAGLVGHEPSLKQPLTTYQTNVMGLVNVCEVARQTDMRKVIFMSSNAAYHAGAGDSLSESDPVFSVRNGNPASHYGTSKMMAEAVGMSYAEFHGLDFLSLRVTAIYGFGMRSPLYVKPMVENAVLGRPTRFATGGAMMRDYTHVADCCDAVCAALDAPRWTAGEQRVLNVACGKTWTASQVAAMVRAEIPGADIEIGEDLTPLEAKNVKMRAPLDISAAKRLLGWAPKLSLPDGIAEYAARFRQSLPQGARPSEPATGAARTPVLDTATPR